MSAITALTAWETPATVTPRRRHLRSVPTGDQVMPVRTRVCSRLRITRRGRLTVTVAVLALVLLGSVGVMRAVASPMQGVAVPTVTVESGQTLSEVAHEALPQLPVREAVARVQIANDLNSSQVHAGQVLQIPQ